MKNANNPYAGYRYPAEIISHGVWLYFRFTLSYRDVEELLAARGIIVSKDVTINAARPASRTKKPRFRTDASGD